MAAFQKLFSNSPRSRAKKAEPRTALRVEALEAREVPALNVHLTYFDGYILNIDVPAGMDRCEGGYATVRVVGEDVQVVHRLAGETDWTATTFRRADLDGPITHISFHGGCGGDRFINDTAIDSDAIGGAGADSLSGGSGRDALSGDGGRDRLSGRDGVDHLYGGADGDTMTGGAGNDVLEGLAGNDWMYGGDGSDVLRGGDNADHLFGEAGNDKLSGGASTDYLYGGNDNDFLDAGSRWETAVGGRGQDINAWYWASDGTQPTDVIQGDAPSCWIVASIASAARAGIDLSSRITYLGDGRYDVRLFQFDHPEDDARSTMHEHQEVVRFDGDRLGADARVTGDDHDTRDTDRAEFWALITQRAIIQAINHWDPSLTVINPHSGGALHPLRMLTGRSGQWLAPSSTTPDRMIRELAAGKAIVFCTGDVNGRLLDGHCYTAMRVWRDVTSGRYFVTLRNPWGIDGGAIGDGVPRDALVTLPWTTLTAAEGSFAMS